MPAPSHRTCLGRVRAGTSSVTPMCQVAYQPLAQLSYQITNLVKLPGTALLIAQAELCARAGARAGAGEAAAELRSGARSRWAWRTSTAGWWTCWRCAPTSSTAPAASTVRRGASWGPVSGCRSLARGELTLQRFQACSSKGLYCCHGCGEVCSRCTPHAFHGPSGGHIREACAGVLSVT